MPLISDSAISLRRLDYSETSQIIVFLTREHGKVHAIAKGIKRGTKTKFAVGIDLLEIGLIVVSARQERSTLATVTEWKQTRPLGGLREKLTNLQAGLYAAEITTQLTQEWDPHTTLYDSLSNLLIALAEGGEPIGLVVAFQIELLTAIGSFPRFEVCVRCERRDELTHFSALQGGMICRHCEPSLAEKHKVTNQTWQALRDHNISNPTGPLCLLNYHISHLMGRPSQVAGKLIAPSRIPSR